MRRIWILVALAVAVAIGVAPALADHRYGRQVRYVGVHPIPKSEGGGMCYIEGPHVHIYAANKLEYRNHEGDHYFVGDPVAYGWDGPKYAYKGPHPIHVDAVVGGDPDVEYCYIQGPHYHYFEPESDPDFKVVGGAYFYVGTPPPPMIEARPQYVGINAYYQPFVYTRPEVEVEAPVGWIGARAEFGVPAVVAPGVVVEGPRAAIGVVVPAPSVHVGLDVGIGIGGGIGVVRPAPAPVFIEGHHDNGRHEGWHKGRR
ncbi:MAG: hypothetical protein ACM31C_32335 [Acidobacteriota bacterium]